MNLARYADKLIKISDRCVCSSGASSKSTIARMSLRTHKSLSFTKIGNEKNNTMGAASTASSRPYNDRCCTSFSPLSDIISNYGVSPKQTHMSMQCLFIKAPADLLVKREETFKDFNENAKSSQSCYRQGCKLFSGERARDHRHHGQKAHRHRIQSLSS